MPIQVSINNLAGELQCETQTNCEEVVSSFLGRLRQAHEFHSATHFLSFVVDSKNLTNETLGSVLGANSNETSMTLSITKVPMTVIAMTVDGDPTIKLYNIVNGALLQSLTCKDFPDKRWTHCKFSNDASLFVCHGISLNLETISVIWDVQTGAQLHVVRDEFSQYSDMHFSSDAASLLLVGLDQVPRIWDVQTMVRVHTLYTRAESVYCSPDAAFLLTQSYTDSVAQIWQFETAMLLRTLESFPLDDGGLRKFSSSGAIIGVIESYHDTDCLQLWDTYTGNRLHDLLGAETFDFHPNGVVVATCSTNFSFVQTWDVQTGSCLGIINIDMHPCSMFFSKCGEWLGVSDVHTYTCIHPRREGRPICEVGSMVVSENSCRVAVWEADCVSAYDLGDCVGRFLSYSQAVECVLTMSRCDTEQDCDLNMLEKILVDDTVSSCLQQQAALQRGILESNSSNTLPSFHQLDERVAHSSQSMSSESVAKTVSSIVSVVGSEPACYISGTAFRDEYGNKKCVELLAANDILLAADGSKVKVVTIKRHANMDQEMVLLRTSSCQLILTHNHRVMIVRRGSQQQTIPAGHLKAGNVVLLSDGPRQLCQVDHFLGGDYDVFEIVLEPDVAIEAFFTNDEENQAILTKGKLVKASTSRRGNMRKRSAGNSEKPVSDPSAHRAKSV